MAGKLNVIGAGLALDGSLGRATVTARTLYLALLTVVPSVTTTVASMNEYSATGYSRQVCAMSAPSGTPRQSINTATITYGPITGANGGVNIVGWALVSSASGATGDVVAQGDLTNARTPVASDQLTVSPGSIVVIVD